MKTNENKSIQPEPESSNLEEIFTLSLVGVTQAEVYHAVERVEGLQRIIKEVKSVREKEEVRIKKQNNPVYIPPVPEKASSTQPQIPIVDFSPSKKANRIIDLRPLSPTENHPNNQPK